jgi:hypothetical protein
MDFTDRTSDVNKEVHPQVRYCKELMPTLEEYIKWPFYRNHQTQFLGSLSIDDLAFVGLYEEYGKTLELAEQFFGRNLGPPQYASATKRVAPPFEISNKVRRLVEEYFPADIELYARAKERFTRQAQLSPR